MNMRHLVAACGLLAVTPCLAAVQWAGDFESGNVNQYTGTQEVSADRLQVVSSPVHQGKYALKVLVKHGDNPIHASGHRNELFQKGGTEEGAEAYYRWSTMFADDFPSAKDWQLFAQWHQPEDCCGSPPIQFYVYGEEIRFTVSSAQTQVWRTPLKRGVWHDFVLHVRFSDDAKVGFVELWYDGQHVLDKTYAATRANGYLKLGLYRSTSITQDGVLYQDAMVRGDTLEDVMPPSLTPPQGPPDQGPGQPPSGSDSPPSSPSSGAPEMASNGASGAGAGAGGCSAGTGAPALAAGLLAGTALLQARRRRHALAARR
ncbi:MAG TPA: polysaccharide lyase [Myxococcaceae bacterium]|jgi:uncharacterized protein (TIGR03382 family)